MSTRVTALTVFLEGTPREDDIEGLITAIRQLRGVADVTPHEYSSQTALAEKVARIRLREEIWKAWTTIIDPPHG